MTSPMKRFPTLDCIEKDIKTCLRSAGLVFAELGKEKCSLKEAENHTQIFLDTLANVENELMEHISYLTQVSSVQPHEGSAYASQKALQMASHRLEHVRSRVNEFDELKVQQKTAAAAGSQGVNNGPESGPESVSVPTAAPST